MDWIRDAFDITDKEKFEEIFNNLPPSIEGNNSDLLDERSE
jgi:hypothetical protein